MGLLAQISRPSGPTRGGPPYPSLRVWLVGYLWYQTSSVGLGDIFFLKSASLTPNLSFLIKTLNLVGLKNKL
jgi:hypothetical protein